ncbi:TIGR02285 family protein, partial [Aduncisulcus paluster]
MKGKGHENYLEDRLQEALPEYKHFEHIANYGRILKQLSENNGCCVTMLKTKEREKFIEFSNPIMPYISNGIITLKSKLDDFKPFIDEQGYISIKDLFTTSPMRMGISMGRRFPHELQWLVSQKLIKDNFVFIPIREMPEYVLSYVGCTKNKWGKRIIHKVNKIVNGQYEEQYKKKYQQYLPKDMIELHEK